jgi:hypothetical protein
MGSLFTYCLSLSFIVLNSSINTLFLVCMSIKRGKIYKLIFQVG